MSLKETLVADYAECLIARDILDTHCTKLESVGEISNFPTLKKYWENNKDRFEERVKIAEEQGFDIPWIKED